MSKRSDGSATGSGKRRCWISIGSNIQRERAVRKAIEALRETFGALVLSRVYETEAEGFDGEPFLNLVAGIETEMSVVQLRAVLRGIEDANGRKRSAERFAPRVLDLDLLTYGDNVGTFDGYVLPRDEILRYAFVLGPLAEVAPDEIHPSARCSYRELWAERRGGWPELRPYALAV